MNEDSIITKGPCIWRCNRGIPIRRQVGTSNDSQLVCLCPPAYYGDRCQYQNQRVSLTVQIQVSFEWRTVFALFISLRDNEHDFIESHDQIQYVPARDCKKKFNIYLLYKSRPKTMSANYSVRFDIYNKQTLEFRATWLFSIRFPFLPVHRMAFQLHVPLERTNVDQCETLQCGMHGHCSRYVNTNVSFCHCDQ
ncbi:unnamed protein product, partial [Rotaria sp. Silwood2]